MSSRFNMFASQAIFSLNLSDIVALRKLKQAGNLADEHLYGGLRVKGLPGWNISGGCDREFVPLQHIGIMLHSPCRSILLSTNV